MVVIVMTENIDTILALALSHIGPEYNGDCRRGVRCTYAHSWDERLEWICPTCTNNHKLECHNKWQHILSYKKLGVMVVDDGRSQLHYGINLILPYIIGQRNYSSLV